MIHFSNPSVRTVAVLRSALNMPDPTLVAGPGLLEQELRAVMMLDPLKDPAYLTPAEERIFESFFAWVGNWSTEYGHADHNNSSFVYHNFNSGESLIIVVVRDPKRGLDGNVVGLNRRLIRSWV